MDNSIYKTALIEFYHRHSSILLNPDEILKASNKLISTSAFSGYNKENIKNLCNSQHVIFAFAEGIVFTENNFYVFDISMGAKRIQDFSIEDFLHLEATHKSFTASGKIKVKGNEIKKESTFKFNVELYEELKKILNLAKDEHKRQIQLMNEEIQRKNEERLRLEKEQLEIKYKDLIVKQNNIMTELDRDGNGEIDLIQNDFNKLLNKNQKQIIEVDKTYIHQFVKVSNFIKTKKSNTQKIFDTIKETSSHGELEERVNLLKNQIHSYELLVFHSINMVGSLVSHDLISFYEIYESFDKLGMFNSNWENEVSDKLTNIGDKLDDLMYSIYNMEQNIVSELNNLSYITQESFNDLNRSVTDQLKEVESSINLNNLLTGIQTYQLYKINKNTRSLRD